MTKNAEELLEKQFGDGSAQSPISNNQSSAHGVFHLNKGIANQKMNNSKSEASLLSPRSPTNQRSGIRDLVATLDA